jgi:hypothetical protein
MPALYCDYPKCKKVTEHREHIAGPYIQYLCIACGRAHHQVLNPKAR